MAPRHVVLVGLMGSGKTTVGARVAGRLGLPFRDGDALLEAATGRTAAALRESAGEAALHRAECEVLREAMAAGAPSVIAAAAAVVDDPACRAALRAAGIAVAMLRADPPVLAQRFTEGARAGGGGTHRPAYGAGPATFLAAQARHRAARFTACRPCVVVDTGRGWTRTPRPSASRPPSGRRGTPQHRPPGARPTRARPPRTSRRARIGGP